MLPEGGAKNNFHNQFFIGTIFLLSYFIFVFSIQFIWRWKIASVRQLGFSATLWTANTYSNCLISKRIKLVLKACLIPKKCKWDQKLLFIRNDTLKRKCKLKGMCGWHSSVVLSVPTILRSRVWIPSTPSMLCSIYIHWLNWNCNCYWNETRTKTNEKETGIGPYLNNSQECIAKVSEESLEH